jgi:uncharacterized membrane protein
MKATTGRLVGLAAVQTLLLVGCSEHPTRPALTAPRLSASQAALTFTTIDAPGASYTSPSGINDARQIVGTFVDPSSLGFDGISVLPGKSHGFLVSGGTFTTIGVPFPSACYPPCPPFETQAGGINTAGQIVGAFDYAYWIFGQYFMQGFLFSGGRYTTIDVAGAFATQASGINDSGRVVGTFVDPPYLSEDWVSMPGNAHGFLLSGRVFTTIDVPGAGSTNAYGINATGQIVGSYLDAAGSHGFLLAGGTFTAIDVPGATAGSTNAYGINATGQIVGSYLDATGSHGFLLAGGTFTPIDVPGATAGSTNAYGINATGQIVGSFGDAKNVVHGFLASR